MKLIKTYQVKNCKTALQDAQFFIDKNSSKIKDASKPTYHFSTPIGWLNDPNGFSYFKGQYHLFYQHYPYKTKWGPMFWGHTTTNDFVKWKNENLALAPDKEYDNYLGCFSGTAYAENELLYIMYTGVCKDNGIEKQQQCMATSHDGINFFKVENNPLIKTEDIPNGYNKVNFRDPKIFKRNGKYYILTGCRKEDENGDSIGGDILLYESENLTTWKFKASLIKEFITKNVLECPDIITLNGKDIIICSPLNLKKDGYRFQNSCSAIYMVGTLDVEKGTFNLEYFDEIDAGFDFYAPQTVNAIDGRVIMTAWMHLWGRRKSTAKEGWVGSFILPRELTLENNKLYKRPVREIENYRKNEVVYKNKIIESGEEIFFTDIKGDILELNLDVDMAECSIFGIKLFCNNKHKTLLYYNKQEELLCLELENVKNKFGIFKRKNNENLERKVNIKLENNKINLNIFLDKSSIEVFAQKGEKTITSTIKRNKDACYIKFYTVNGKAIINEIRKFDIIINKD